VLSKHNDEAKNDESDNLQSLVHFSNSASPSQILDYNQIVMNKPFPMANGLRFVTIECLSQHDAIRRSLAFSLLTIMTKRRTFAKIYTKQQLESGFTLLGLMKQLHVFQVTAHNSTDESAVIL